MIQAPRLTGEVVVPLAVTLKTLACVNKPPRALPFGKVTGRKATPVTPRSLMLRSLSLSTAKSTHNVRHAEVALHTL